MQVVQHVHKNISTYVPFLLMMKIDFTENFGFFFLSYFFRFIGVLILCGDFSFTEDQVIREKTLSKWLRNITSFKLVNLLGIGNLGYIIVSLAIFVLFCVRIFFYGITIHKIKEKKDIESIRPNKFQIFMDHIVFLLYPFLLEFLAFSIFILILPDKFVIKKTENMLLNIIVCILNVVLIIAYNVNGVIYMTCVNRPLTDKRTPVKYRYSDKKFYLIFLLQNLVILECLNLYLEGTSLKIYKIIMAIFLIGTFAGMYFTSLLSFNYPTILNNFVDIMAIFSFYSILIDAILYFLKYEITDHLTLAFFTIIKIILAVCFQYITNTININFLLKYAKTELFKINKEIEDNVVYDVFLFIYDMMKNIKNSKGDASSQNLLNIIFLHQAECQQMNCKCKIIQIIPYGENYEKNFIPNLIERSSFLVESAFVQIDYSKDYDLTLLLCEHYCYFKDNPIMAYSMVQTLLHFNYEKLKMSELIQLYEVADKYIEVSLTMAELQLTRDLELGNKAGFNQILKENKFKDIYFMLQKIKKIKKLMATYAQNEITIIKYKELIEESIKLHKDEDTGEIKKITTSFLTTENIGKILTILENEVEIYKDLFDYIEQLNGQKLPIEFYYKCFLFAELFWGGKITEQIVPTMYSFTNDRNMYSTNLNPSVYFILRQRYIDLNLQGNSTYNAIFKYTKGMVIEYYSEPLANRLGFHQIDVIKQNIEVLLPKDLQAPHNTAVLRFLIMQQNRVFPKIKNFMFDKFNQIYSSTIYGASLPGLGRNLMILIVIELKELINEYYFLLNKNYELMAVSENFEKNYDLSMPLIEKFGINLMEIFEINLDKLKYDFQEDIKNILTLKHNMEIMTGEYFTKRLFRQNTKAGGKYNLNKFKLLDDLEKEFRGDSTGNNVKFLHKLRNAQLMIEKIYNHKISEKIDCSKVNLRINKQSVINNLVKVVNKLTEVDLHDESYKKLTESVFKFKNYNHVKEEDNNNLVKGNVNNNSYDSYFDIEARISVLYDSPFYAFKLTEITKTTPGIQNLNDSCSMSQRSGRKVTFTNSRTGGTNTQSISMNASKTKTISMKKNLNSVINNVKNNEIKCFKYITYMIVLLLIVLLIIYVYIIFYQNDIISTGYNIFLGLYYNYFQRDKLLCLFSTILSSYYLMYNITNYGNSDIMEKDNLKNIMEEYSMDFQNSFHYFYISYIDYKRNLGEPLTALYEPRMMDKITTDWQNMIYESDYISEAEFISYSANNAAIDLQLESNVNLTKEEDCPRFFQENYRKYPKNKTRSDFIQCMYYLCKNYNSQFYYFFREIQEESEHSFLNFSKETKSIYIFIEILGMIFYVVFFGVMFFYLYQSNSMMFKNILNMFLDFTQEGVYNFKNHIDNFILIKKISEFNLLLVDFSLGILDKYNKKISARSVVTGNMNMSMDEGQGFSVIKSDNVKDNADSMKKEDKKKKRNKKDDKKDKGLNMKNQNANNTSKIDTSKGGLISQNSSVGFNKLNTSTSNLKKGNNTNTSTNMSLNLSQNTTNSQKNLNNTGYKQPEKKEEIDDNGVTTDMILEKTQNKGIFQIKVMIYIFIVLFCVILIYFFVKLFVSIGFIDDIKNIFDDFGTVSFKYSMVYYYFNTLRVLLVVPKFTDENIFDTMENDLIDETNNINDVLNYRMKNYESTNILFTAFTKSQNDTSVTNITAIICEDNKLCNLVASNKEFNMIADGIDVAINAIVQETQNIYNDYKKIRDSNNGLLEIKKEDVTNWYINDKFKQVDVNLNFVLSLVQQRIYTAFLEDSDNLTHKFQNMINIFNSCAIIYCCLLGIFVIIFVVYRIKNMTKIVEDSTMRLNKAFFFIKENNLGNQMNSQTNSIL